MSQHYQTITIPESQLESKLNSLGIEGWVIVNCWPANPSGHVFCVLKRTCEYWCHTSRSFQPCRSLHLLDLEVALERCLAAKKSLNSRGDAILLGELGKEFDADEESVFEQLVKSGLAESPKLKEAHSAFQGGYLMVVRKQRDKQGRLWLNIKKTKLNESTEAGEGPKTSDKRQPDPEPAPPAPLETQRPTIEALINRCMENEPKNKGWPHSVSLAVLAKQFETSQSTLREIIEEAGVPETPKDPKKPFVFVKNRLVGLKKSKGAFYLNVKPQPTK